MMKLIVISLLGGTLRDGETGVGFPPIVNRLGTTRDASACLNWLTY